MSLLTRRPIHLLDRAYAGYRGFFFGYFTAG